MVEGRILIYLTIDKSSVRIDWEEMIDQMFSINGLINSSIAVIKTIGSLILHSVE